jgi:uncharacterized protein (TIGR02646 family)
MKHIIKQSEPIKFSEWKSLANDEWQPTYSNLRGDEKRAVHISLMEEQGYICCYCENRLIEMDSHIEHFRPQHDPMVDALDYGNIICSCQDRIKKGDPRHCGNLKNKWFDDKLLISPLEEGCENRFLFNGDGTITPTDPYDKAAITTIKKLGLDLPLMNQSRNQAIELFLDEDLTKEEFDKFVYDYLQKDNQGMFGEFWTTIKQLFESGNK